MKKIRLPARSKRSSSGLNLIEVAIVLGITGLIIGGVWAVSSVLGASNKQRKASQELALIAQNVRVAFAEQSGVLGQRAHLTLALDRFGSLPTEMRQNANMPAGIMFNPWSQLPAGGLGSAVVYASDCTGSEAPDDTTPEPCFAVGFLNVPQSACVQMATQSPSTSTGVQGVIINSSGFLTLPVTGTAAASNCSNATNNTISWVYLLKDNPS